MQRYGYIEKDNGTVEALYTEEGIANIIKTVQRFGAIEETGKIDEATLKVNFYLKKFDHLVNVYLFLIF